jgi:HlyD family secretion protein
MTADVRILVETKRDVLLLPIEAVQTIGARSKVVWLDPSDGEVKKVERDVTVGARNDREVEIAAGLGPGDQVLIQPPPPEKK